MLIPFVEGIFLQTGGRTCPGETELRPRSTKTTCFILFLFFLFCPPVSAQFNLLYQKDGEAAGDGFGWSVASAGDVDGDGTDDFQIGAPGVQYKTGSAYLYSGATGSLLYQKNGEGHDFSFGFSLAGTADVSGDARPELIIGSPDVNIGARQYAGRVYVYSGASTSQFPLYQKSGTAGGGRFGHSVAEIGDVSGDGKPDFIVGAFGYQFYGYDDYPSPKNVLGSAYVYSGANGSLLLQRDGSADGDGLGYSVAGAGDVNRDGVPDYIIGAPLASPSGNLDAGSVYVYSGAIAKVLLFKKDGAYAGAQFGFSVAGAGDVDGDGWADFIVGAPFSSQVGSAYVYSGLRGSLLYQMNGDSSNDFFGFSATGAGDVDGDGKTDFLIGAPNASRNGKQNNGSVYLYSGATGALLFQKDGAASYDHFGLSVAGAGDVNGDGKQDIIIGAPHASPNGLYTAGSVYIYGPTCAAKGDMNVDSDLTAADVMLMLNCVFFRTGSCALCFADINCDGALAPADLVLELFSVFAALSFPC